MKPAILILTPFVIGIFAAVFRTIWVEPSNDLANIAVLALRYSLITYAIAIVFGAPAYLLIRRAGLRAAWQVVGIGAVLGAVNGALIPLVLGKKLAIQFFSGLYRHALEYAMFGAITAFAAWWFFIRSKLDVGAHAKESAPSASG